MSETGRPVPEPTMIRDLMPTTPFIGLLGMRFDEWEPDRIVLRLPFVLPKSRS